MWSVSDAYKDAVDKQSRRWKAEVRVTYKNGEQAVFTDETIKDGITIHSQMVSGDEGSNTIDIGAVPEKKIELTLIDTDSDLHRYAGARLSVNVSLKLENGEYEKVPMGVFFVDSSAITRLGTNIHIVGYDGMLTFQYNLSDFLREQLKGQKATRAAQILASRSACGFNQDLSGFPNGNIPLDFDSAQVVTGWDGIMWIAQVMGCFGRINRQNYLEFVPIKFEWEYFDDDHTSGRIVENRTIHDSVRYDNTTFSDDRMHIVGVAMPGDGKYITSGGTGGNEQDANITILLEKNPIIANSGKSTIEILDAIRQQLWSVCFYAFKIDIENDPALDAGDIVRLKGGVINGTNKNNDLYGFITHNEWHYQERQTITSTGQTPIVYENAAGDISDSLFQLPAEPQSNKKQLGVNSEIEKQLVTIKSDNDKLKETVEKLSINGSEYAKYLQTHDGMTNNSATMLCTMRSHDIGYIGTNQGGVGLEVYENKAADTSTRKLRIKGTLKYTKETGVISHPIKEMDCKICIDPSDKTINNSNDQINISAYGRSNGTGQFYAYGGVEFDGLWVSNDPTYIYTPRYVRLFYALFNHNQNEYRQEFTIANVNFKFTDEGITITRPHTSSHFYDGNDKIAFIPWNNTTSSSAILQSEYNRVVQEEKVQTMEDNCTKSDGDATYTYDENGIHICYNGHTKIIPWDI